METITLTKNTLVDRKLAWGIMCVSNLFVVYIILLVSFVLYFDFQANWEAQRYEHASYIAEKDPAEAQKMYKELRKYKSFYDHSPAMYSSLRKNSLYVLVGIPLFSVLVGAVLSLYRSVTINLLLYYHVFLITLMFSFILFVMLTLTVAHGLLSYSMVPPIDLHAHCYHDED